MIKFVFPVVNFRKFASPFENQGGIPFKFCCYVEICDIPSGLLHHIIADAADFKDDQREEDIKVWMLHHDRDLHLKVRPIVVNASRVSFDNHKNKATLLLADPTTQGVVFGATALKAIVDYRGQCDNHQFVEFQFIVNLPNEDMNNYIKYQHM